METFKSYEDALTKALQVEIDEDILAYSIDTWEQMGRPRLHESGIYLKLADQGLIEPIGVWKNVDTTINGISTKFDFEIIDPKEGSNSFPTLVG